jgi:hypothetical protein
MASFQTHLSFGLVLGAACVFAIVGLALAPAAWNFFILIFLAASAGAIMPDMDSDTGVPFHITFGSLALAAGGLTFMYMLKTVPDDILMIGAYTLGAIFTVWVILGTIFKKFTIHRGMAHSIPSALLAGLAVFTVAVRTGLDPGESFLLGLSLSLGFVLHLVLDEVNSAVNFHGQVHVPNKALGSALKFFSDSGPINVLVYASLTLLLIGNGPSLYGFMVKLAQAI